VKPLADSPVEVARSTRGEVASRTSGLPVTHPFRTELAISNDSLLRNACMVREKQALPENCFKTTPFGELVFKTIPFGEICRLQIWRARIYNFFFKRRVVCVYTT